MSKNHKFIKVVYVKLWWRARGAVVDGVLVIRGDAIDIYIDQTIDTVNRE